MKFKINHDVCSGCKVCQLICSLTHFKEVNPKKGALKIHGHFPEPGIFTINVCTQCGICADACPGNAIQEIDGAYIIDKELCTNCGLCAEACPEQVIVMREDTETPIKCDNCGECIKLCPRGALMDEQGVIKNDIWL